MPDDWQGIEDGVREVWSRGSNRGMGGWVKVLYKRVRGSRDFLKEPLSWVVNAKTYEAEIRHCVDAICLLDLETGIEYSLSLFAFDRLKDTVDRGSGLEYSLDLAFWSTAQQECPGGSYLIGTPRLS